MWQCGVFTWWHQWLIEQPWNLTLLTSIFDRIVNRYSQNAGGFRYTELESSQLFHCFFLMLSTFWASFGSDLWHIMTRTCLSLKAYITRKVLHLNTAILKRVILTVNLKFLGKDGQLSFVQEIIYAHPPNFNQNNCESSRRLLQQRVYARFPNSLSYLVLLPSCLRLAWLGHVNASIYVPWLRQWLNKDNSLIRLISVLAALVIMDSLWGIEI